MIEKRCCQLAWVISCWSLVEFNTSCEVFDSFSRKFTSVHSAVLKTLKPINFEAVCIGKNILVFAWNVIPRETKVFIL